MNQVPFRQFKRITLFLLLPVGILLIGRLAYSWIRQPAPPVVPQNHAIQPIAGEWWKPSPGKSWQWQLSGEIDPSMDVQMYDVDLFDTPQRVIDQLHAQGRVVICYFSAGTHENWRPHGHLFPEEVLGTSLPDWPGERWLDIRQMNKLDAIKQAPPEGT